MSADQESLVTIIFKLLQYIEFSSSINYSKVIITLKVFATNNTSRSFVVFE